jgi:flagellar biosynthesis/type III secretory pathway ATPase
MTQFDCPDETMTMSVVIADTGDEASRKMQAVARAKELARYFYEQAEA